jgi:hypothetical protein
MGHNSSAAVDLRAGSRQNNALSNTNSQCIRELPAVQTNDAKARLNAYKKVRFMTICRVVRSVCEIALVRFRIKLLCIRFFAARRVLA